jgi:hypothetical protein
VQRILPPVFEAYIATSDWRSMSDELVRLARVLRDRPTLAPMLSWRSSMLTGFERRSSRRRQMPSRMLPAIGPMTTMANSSPPRRKGRAS